MLIALLKLFEMYLSGKNKNIYEVFIKLN